MLGTQFFERYVDSWYSRKTDKGEIGCCPLPCRHANHGCVKKEANWPPRNLRNSAKMGQVHVEITQGEGNRRLRNGPSVEETENGIGKAGVTTHVGLTWIKQ